MYVYRLQEKLIENGYEISADAYFGDETENAVIDYQMRHPALRNEDKGKVTYLMMQILGPWEEEWGG